MSRSNRYGKYMTCTEGVRVNVVGEESCTHVGDTGLSDVTVATYKVKLGHGLGVCTALHCTST